MHIIFASALIMRCVRRLAQNYDYVVEQQPIGKELFRQFCRGEVEGGKSIPSVAPPKSSLDSKTLLDFLDAVVCILRAPPSSACCPA